jgi:hypothetical protein
MPVCSEAKVDLERRESSAYPELPADVIRNRTMSN